MSDIELPDVLLRSIACDLAKGMNIVCLVGIEIQVVLSEGLLQSKHFEQIMGSEIGSPFKYSLELPRRHPCDFGHIPNIMNFVEVSQNSLGDIVRNYMFAIGELPNQPGKDRLFTQKFQWN